jgi:hypothetical protein
MPAKLKNNTVEAPAREIPILSTTDVVVCGGGVAGLSAAIAAGRAGSRTMLIERDGFLGGALTSALMSQWGNGSPNMSGLGAELRDRLVQSGGAFRGESVISIEPEAFKDLAFAMCEQSGVELLLFTEVVDVVMDGKQICGVVVQTKSGPKAIMAKVVIDASGDADIAVSAGAPVVKGRESDGRMRPISLLFRIGNVDIERVVQYVREHPEDFLVDPHRHVVDYEHKALRLIGFFKSVETAKERNELDKDCHYIRLEAVLVDRNMVMVNSTRIYDADGTDPRDLGRAMLEGRRQMHQLFGFLHKYIVGFEDSYIVDSAPRLGIRETRRIIGDYVLTEEDIAEDREFSDTFARTFMRHMPGRDVHSPDAGEGDVSDDVYRTSVMPVTGFNMPYRILLPQKVEGLLVAGRCMSVNQEADRWTRNQPPLILAGQAAGVAAALSVARGINPRELDPKILQKGLGKDGVMLPERPEALSA